MRIIDANKLIQTINVWREKLVDTYGANDEYVICLENVSDIIEKVPIIEERKKGQWRYYDGMCSCSVCNSHMDDISPFCPMCGADMRG